MKEIDGEVTEAAVSYGSETGLESKKTVTVTGQFR